MDAIILIEHATVRSGQHLDYDGLRDAAREAVERDGRQQYEIAESLGVSASALSKAIRVAGSKYAALQQRTIAALTAYRVSKEVTVRFKVSKQGEEG